MGNFVMLKKLLSFWQSVGFVARLICLGNQLFLWLASSASYHDTRPSR
jgi:hypothetical protein